MGEARKHGVASAKVRPIGTADWPTRAVRPVNSILNSEKFASDFGFIMPDWRKSVSSVVGRLAGEALAASASGTAARSDTA
jgi:dTDP-4-dehydrorhamnose reductase